MIIINLKPTPVRSSNTLPETSSHYYSSLANWRLTSHPHIWRPPTDVYETEDNFVVIVEIAGMYEKNFSVTLDQNVLTISGERPDTLERKSFHQMEIYFGEFVTEVELSSPIDVDRCVAEYTQGFLWVWLPKLTPKKIIISEGD
jgi:HSP20 family protein